MAISIQDWSEDTEDLFTVTFFSYRIKTTVTAEPSVVTEWITDIERIHRRRLHNLVVGLDIEWRPNSGHYNNPAATLQLCVGRICLIYQLIYTDSFPLKLRNFLRDEDYTFVGVEIGKDAEKLEEDWGLEVSNVVDLRGLAEERMGVRRNAGLKTLAREVMGFEVEKPKRVARSRWDELVLSYDQIQYACVDAFLSFEIGKRLNAAHHRSRS